MVDVLDQAVAWGRAEAEARMRARCVIRRSTGETVTNPDFTTSPELITIYDPAAESHKGKCRVHGDRPHEQNLTAGGGTHIVQRLLISLPALSGPYRPGDIVTIIESPDQPNMVGRSYRIGGIDERSQQTAQRMYIDLNWSGEVPPWQT